MKEAFVNVFEWTKALQKEYVLGVLTRPVLTYGPVIAIAGVVMFFVMEDAFRYISLTAGLIALIASLLTPFWTLHELRALEGERDGQPSRISFGDEIVVSDGRNHLTFSYQQVKAVKETPHLYALMLGNHSAILVKKGAFEQGKEGDFLPFLTKKGKIKPSLLDRFS